MSSAPENLPDPYARIAELEALLAGRDLLIDKLRAQIAKLRRLQFGRSSEKLARELGQLELALEELEAAQEMLAAQRPASATRERPPAVRAWPAHLPRVEVVHEPASGSCTCPACGGTLRRLGLDDDEQLDVVRVTWRVVRNVRPKYSCRACEQVVQAPAPPKPIERGRATFATLAHVAVAKYDHHLPLYRQAEMMAAQGVEIDRSTMARWMGQAAALIDPIVSRIRETGLAATKLHVDDTPVPVLDPGTGKTATGRVWTHVVDDRASGSDGPVLAWYRFTPDRSGKHCQAELASFAGHLQADAYQGYDKLYETGRVIEVPCWGHFRRKIFDEHASQATALTTEILEKIGAMYAVEAEVRGQPPDVRRAARQEKTKPIVNELKAILDAALRRLSPSGDMAKAIAYGTRRWERFCRFLDDGGLEIDNLAAERSLRGLAIGRRNWLFAGSQAGAIRAAAIYTVIETAKLNGLEPEAYLADVMEKIASGWPASRWDELMPWNWRPAETLAEAA